MPATIYARISPDFDSEAPTGVLVAATDLRDTYGFTELGYDNVDYDVAPTVVAVTPHVERYADADDIYAVAAEARIEIDEDDAPNALLFDAKLTLALESAGFQAFRDRVPVTNEEPELYAFWNPDSFSVSEPIATVALDPDRPYHVGLAAKVPSLTP